MARQLEPRAPYTLAELQAWLRWVIVEPHGVEAALDGRATRVPAGETSPRLREPEPRCLQAVTEAPPVSRTERLSVYAEGYFARIAGALEKDFPTTRRWIGELAFQKLVADYLEIYPSRFASIADVGWKLAPFSSEHELAQQAPALPDLVTLERAVLESFYAEDVPPIDPKRVAGIAPDAWPGVRLVLDPSVRLLNLAYPVHLLWEARESADEEFPLPMPHETTKLLVFRENALVRVKPLAAPAWHLLREASRGARLAKILEALPSEHDAAQAAQSLSAWFEEWTRSGVIRDLLTAP